LSSKLYLLLAMFTGYGCVAAETYESVAEGLVAPKSTVNTRYSPEWTPIDDDKLCHLPGRTCEWEPDMEGCLYTLNKEGLFPGQTVAAVEIVECMAEKGWRLELDKEMVIIVH